jgi:hypothetical protein
MTEASPSAPKSVDVTTLLDVVAFEQAGIGNIGALYPINFRMSWEA